MDMEDDLEDRIIYQTYISHIKLLSKLVVGLFNNSTNMGYSWRLFRVYFLKPEILIFTVLILLFILYIPMPTLDLHQYYWKNLGDSVVSTSRSDDSNWEYKSDNVAVYAVQGRRPHMEDRFVINENIKQTGVSIFAVFDGHGGAFAADYAAKNLIETLKSRVIELKEMMNDRSAIRRDSVLFRKPSSVPTSEMLSKDEKISKKFSTHFDDTKTLEKNISIMDPELIEKLSKILPISKEVTSLKSTETVSRVNSEVYFDSKGKIDYNKLLTDEVLATDKLLVDAAKKSLNIAGSTALIALMEKQYLIVANVGDSRGVMCDCKGNAIPLSFDHKPQQMREKKRIQDAGGFVAFNGVWRVAGILATSRALGDYPLKDKNFVIANPDILTFNLSDHKPQFLIFASDGLWDIFTNEEAVAFIRDRLNEPLFGAKSITLQAYHKGSLDNITVLVINLSNYNWADVTSSINDETTIR